MVVKFLQAAIVIFEVLFLFILWEHFHLKLYGCTKKENCGDGGVDKNSIVEVDTDFL